MHFATKGPGIPTEGPRLLDASVLGPHPKDYMALNHRQATEVFDPNRSPKAHHTGQEMVRPEAVQNRAMATYVPVDPPGCLGQASITDVRPCLWHASGPYYLTVAAPHSCVVPVTPPAAVPLLCA